MFVSKLKTEIDFRTSYYLLKPISLGDNAELWLACECFKHKFKDFCVLKGVVDEDDLSRVRKLVREGCITSRLRHSNIITCRGYYEVDIDSHSLAYLIMDYVFGCSLSQVQQHLASLDEKMGLPVAIEIIYSVGKALAYIHEYHDVTTLEPSPIIHQDVSPANIMISYSGEVKVIDFGVAVDSGNDLLSGKSVGKITYMAPEQLDGHPVSVGSDLYSLGIIFWEVLCGKRLFSKKDSKDERLKKAEVGIAHPSVVNPDVPEELAEICMKCLNVKVEDRYSRVADFLEALWRFKDKLDCCNRSCVQDFMGKFFSNEYMAEKDFLHEAKKRSFAPENIISEDVLCSDIRSDQSVYPQALEKESVTSTLTATVSNPDISGENCSNLYQSEITETDIG